MANKDLAATSVAALRLNSTSPQGHAAATIGPGSTLRLVLLAAALAILAGVIPNPAGAFEVCEKTDVSNQVCNQSFEDLSSDDSDLPLGWAFAAGHDLDESSQSDAYASSDRPRSGEGVLKVVRGGDVVILDSHQLVPVTAGLSYRLGMDYRFDRFGDDPRGRIALQVVYLDEAMQPIRHLACSHDKQTACFSDDDCGEQGLCTAVSNARAGIASKYDPAVDGSWSHVQGTIEPGTYRTFPKLETVDAAYAKLRIYTNSFFEGEASIDNLSLAILNEAALGVLPEGSLAYDLASQSCSPDDASCTCPDGLCEEAASGFETLPVGLDAVGDAGCALVGNPAEGTSSGSYPTALLGRNVDRPTIECRADSSTDYVLSLYMGGHWRTDPRSESHKIHINDSVGAALDESRVCYDSGDLDGSICSSDADCGSGVCAERDIYSDIYFSRVHESLVTPTLIEGKGHAIYDEYIWPRRYRRHDIAVSSDGQGRIEIQVKRGAVGALVLTPGTFDTADLATLDDYEAQMREEFVSRWANYVEPEDMGLPVVQGDYEASSDEFARGFVLFRRNWMDFVEFSSRPGSDDVIVDPARSGLSLRATPGEYEPVTFSVWPLRDLADVSLEVSDLRSAAGDAIPAEVVSTWYLQQRPQRIDPPTSFGFVSGFLPDWEQRQLYAGITQRAWLNVKVPEGTPAGTYAGSVTLQSKDTEPVAIALEIEVLPFELIRPARTHVMRWAAGNGLIVPVDKEMHRRAALRDLREHGVQPEIGIWWPSLLKDASARRSASSPLGIDWDARTFAGTPDEQVAGLLEVDARGTVWIDSGSIQRMGLLDAFGAEGGSDWSIGDTEAWLNAIETRFGPTGYGFEEVLLHITAEESHFLDGNGQASAKWYAWLDFLAFVSQNRSTSNWPHIRTTHSFNTNAGQDQALAEGNIDLPALGMFHGVDSDASDQISQAQGLGNPFLLYGVRGRLVPGFYLWRAGASGTFHEWYSRSDGALNNDWDNRVSYGPRGEPQNLLHEGPAWSNTQYSQDGKMVGSWMWEEIREAIDDDAYMNTLESWIEATASDTRPEVRSARDQALETLAWIRSQVDLDAVGLHDPEETAVVSKRYSRSGLTLVRSEEPDVNGFHQLRDRAIDAIAALALADRSAPEPIETPIETPAEIESGSGSGSSDWTGETESDPQPESEAGADAPAPEDDPSEETDGEVVLLPEPGSAATGIVVALVLGVMAGSRRNLRV